MYVLECGMFEQMLEQKATAGAGKACVQCEVVYILFHYSLLQGTEYFGMSLCPTIGHCCFSVSVYNSYVC